MADDGIEELVRQRLRGLRVALGLSLDEVAARTHLSPSTISRIETGKRSITLDLLEPLCAALQTDLASLLDTHTDDDVVIRPVPVTRHGRIHWPLTRPGAHGGLQAARMRIEPRRRPEALGVHPGRDWFYVLSGTVVLTLGTREIEVHEGEAAEFSTMTPHRFGARGTPAEIITIFDRDGRRAHLTGPGGAG
jgi:transcriptional regulator with XRE-family HTH domain